MTDIGLFKSFRSGLALISFSSLMVGATSLIMLPVEDLLSCKLKTIILSCLEIAIFNQVAFASPRPGYSFYLCYIELKNGQVVNLSHLCGEKSKQSNNTQLDSTSNPSNNLSNNSNSFSKLNSSTEEQFRRTRDQLEEVFIREIMREKSTLINNESQGTSNK